VGRVGSKYGGELTLVKNNDNDNNDMGSNNDDMENLKPLNWGERVKKD
jgi:hypothetical protein